MKFASFTRGGGGVAVGVVDVARGEVLGLAAAAARGGRGAPAFFASMLALIDGGDAALAAAREEAARWPAEAAFALKDVRILAPLPEPRSLRDCLVFEQHLVNAQKQWEAMTGRPPAPIPEAWYQRPGYYKGNRFSVVGPDVDVRWPSYSELMDFELELACVIGKPGRDIAPEDALSHVFGFTIFNDFSARDMQVVERPLGMGAAKSKDFDTGNALGPWIVTTDEIGDPQALRMEARVNGERWGGGTSADMHHSFAAIVSFVSRDETLRGGEVIASGTVPTGCGLELGRFLNPGDVVELEIERIGVLRNRIVRPQRGGN
jgi:2-keto-4-pentenoate hydratase/2-oxohepta-3-ene-1,7-dioic acid hydratase in catechol pathway